jgi:hypothetical protein
MTQNGHCRCNSGRVSLFRLIWPGDWRHAGPIAHRRFPRLGGSSVAEKQRSREVCSKPFTGAPFGRISAMDPQHRAFPTRGTDVHGTITPQRGQLDAASLAVYLIIIATAAVVILIHPKPELIPLLLWHAGHPL